ncbi:1-acyl-sn-glycerol-3-phosphate acyltransferase [Candidatus Binatia bacterium]|nr:1-acyl-sn-glycerol-3-phosphate acyltransferase [Candidatus Binatia bacterium]
MAHAPRNLDSTAALPVEAFMRAVHLLWGLVADIYIFFSTMFMGTAALGLTLALREPWPVDVLGRFWARWMLKVCGINVDVEGLERLDPKRSYVLVSNHLSNFDIWATLGALPLTIHFVAKKELLSLPFLGQALAVSDHIIIDRANPEAAVACINERVAAQIDKGFCILFYAEGTRSPDGKVHAFKKGGITLALRTGLPIVPLSVSGTRKFLPKRRMIIKPGGRVKLALGEPIDTRAYTLDQRDELTEYVRKIVIQNYIEDY